MLGSTVFISDQDLETEFYINDQTSINSGFVSDGIITGTQGFYIQITQVDGLFGADISYESDPLPQDTGEISGDVFRRGKGLTLSGVIWANGLFNLEAGSQYLQSVWWKTLPKKIGWNPLNRANATPGGELDTITAIYLHARVNNDLVISQALSNFSYGVVSVPWTVGLRADDPRIYNWADDTVYLPWQV